MNALPASAIALALTGILPCTAPLLAADDAVLGAVSFSGHRGDVREYKPATSVWTGTFIGVSLMKSGGGPLHNAGWECTGEVVSTSDTMYRAAGFCVVTDRDGDTVQCLWERTDVPGSGDEMKAKGTYLLGTGKYAGIRGTFSLACRAATSACDIVSNQFELH